MGLVLSILVIWITKVRELLAHHWKRQTQRQFTIVIKIIITLSVVHFPNELNQKRSQYYNWSCKYKLSELSLTLNLLSAFHTICCSLVPLNQPLSLACAKFSPVFKLLNSSKVLQGLPLPKFLCYFNLYSTNTFLS